jgi:Vacuolar sorting protein 9 (VPS9) domain
MLKVCAPLEKLFLLRDLKDQIQEEVQEFWSGVITDPSKLVLTRDELTSILLFLLCKAEVPDLYTQMRLTNEFTSPDI